MDYKVQIFDCDTYTEDIWIFICSHDFSPKLTGWIQLFVDTSTLKSYHHLTLFTSN